MATDARKAPPNRIRERREARGWTLDELAEKIGTHKQQLYKLEKGKIRLSQDWMQKISEALGCRIVDILPADPHPSRQDGSSRSSEKKVVAPTKQPPRESAVVYELDVRVSSGDGALAEGDEDHQVLAEWQLPAEYLRTLSPSPHEHIKIVEVQGDSMIPDFWPGERVMVDTVDRKPSPPGVFVLWDGLGIVMKRVEVIPNSNPLRVRLIPRNGQYETYERPLAEVHINARVIGKWQRT